MISDISVVIVCIRNRKYIYIYVTGTKTGSETKRQHFVLSVKMVNWHGHCQVCR